MGRLDSRDQIRTREHVSKIKVETCRGSLHNISSAMAEVEPWWKVLGSSWEKRLGLVEWVAVLGTSGKVNLGGIDSSLGDSGEGSILSSAL